MNIDRIFIISTNIIFCLFTLIFLISQAGITKNVRLGLVIRFNNNWKIKPGFELLLFYYV